ncbi:MAG: ABC transporter substrate-binding protein [Planctomycetes bacterium]|nr:ABC transporter substrate-binding protein [Planctomycetota bacterium]
MVRLTRPARRIISLAPSNTETLFQLGAGAQLAGRDDFSDFPTEALRVPSIGSTHPKVNAEVIVALEPDLVLAAGTTNHDDVRSLSGLGLTVYVTSVAARLKDIWSDMLAVARLVGRVSEGESLVAELRERVARVVEKTSAARARPCVFYEIDGTESSKPWTAGPGSFIAQMIELAGGRNAGGGGRDRYFQVSLEELVAVDPVIIILGSATYGGQTPAIVKARPGWQGIAAVRSGAIYPFDDNLVARPGPRVVLGLETLARLIHPELFP